MMNVEKTWEVFLGWQGQESDSTRDLQRSQESQQGKGHGLPQPSSQGEEMRAREWLGPSSSGYTTTGAAPRRLTAAH